ncbi:hypothetical protein [Streptomyces sp. KS_5]|nr:hypothetical protein [Streptomyces sp. KS_5]
MIWGEQPSEGVADDDGLLVQLAYQACQVVGELTDGFAGEHLWRSSG